MASLVNTRGRAVSNCQIGVFCAYVSRYGHAFIDRALYLPKASTDDPTRMTATHVPNGIAFATKPALAVKMISRALAANVPFSWVAADSVYGVGDIKNALRHAGKSYVLGVSASRHFGSWRGKPPVAGAAEEIAHGLASSGGAVFRRAKARKAQGSMTGLDCELADLDAAEYDEERSGLWTRGLLIRHNIADGDFAFFSRNVRLELASKPWS